MSQGRLSPHTTDEKCGGPAGHRRLLYWQDTCCLVESCDLAALSLAARLLNLRVASPSPGDPTPPHVLLQPADGAYSLVVSKGSYTVPLGSPIAYYLAATIPWAFYNLSPDPVLHAACCVLDGEAVLFCGGSETGKSTLTAAAWERGLEVMNDDCVAVDPARALVRPFPQALSLRLQKPEVPEPFRCFVGQSGQYSLATGFKCDRWVLFGRSLLGLVPYGVDRPVRALYLARRGASTRRVPAERHGALHHLLAQTRPGRAGGLAILPFIQALLGQGKIYELEMGDQDVAGALELALSPLS